MGEGQSPKDLVRSFYESLAARDIDGTFERYVSRQVMHHGMGGETFEFDTWKEADRALLAFEGLSVKVQVQIAEGDKVATLWTMGGAHREEFFGIPPTGREVSWTGMVMDRVADDKVTEHWVAMDWHGLLEEMRGEG